MKNKKNMFLGYVALIYSVYLLFVLISNFSARTEEHWRFFYAFTQQSNILCMIWLFLFGISSFKQGELYKKLTNNTLMTSLTVYISITFFIVLFILDPVYQGIWNPLKSTSELFLHQLTPVMMWIYYFLIKGNGTMNYKKMMYILIYPLLYFGANLWIGGNYNYLDGSAAYAYNFANPNNYGNWFAFLGFIGVLVLIFFIFGVILMKFKQYLEKEYYPLT